jgi:hypothetical protein
MYWRCDCDTLWDLWEWSGCPNLLQLDIAALGLLQRPVRSASLEVGTLELVKGFCQCIDLMGDLVWQSDRKFLEAM